MGNVKNKQKRGEEMSVFYRDIDVKISNYKSELSKPLVVYERDRGLEIYFNLIEYAYRLDKHPANLLENLVGAYATVTLVNPDGYEISVNEVEITEEAKVKFVITEDLTDELTEIGIYQLQIHVNNDVEGRDTSVFSVPPFNFEVRERLKGRKNELLDSEGNGLTDKEGYQLVSATSNKIINFSADKINEYLNSIPTIQGKIKDLNSQLDTKANLNIVNNVLKTSFKDKPIITLLDDDCRREFLTIIKPELDKRGLKSSLALITSKVGSSDTLTLEELKQLSNDGFDLLCHSHTHSYDIYKRNILTQNDSVIENDIKLAQDYMRKNGFDIGAETFVYPYGNYTGADALKIKSITRKYFTNCIDANGGMIKKFPYDNCMMPRKIFEFKQASNLDYAKQLIDECKTTNAWFILGTHAWSNVTQSMYGEMLDYLVASGVTVMTLSQALKYKGNVISVGEYTSENKFFVSANGNMETSNVKVESTDSVISSAIPQNLLKQTETFSDLYWVENDISKVSGVRKNGYKGKDVLVLTQNWQGKKQSVYLEKDKTYTCSVIAKANKPNITIGLYTYKFVGNFSTDLSTSWKRYSVTFTHDSDSGEYFILPESSNVSTIGGEILMCCYQLEEGDKASDFVLNDEDLKYKYVYNDNKLIKSKDFNSTYWEECTSDNPTSVNSSAYNGLSAEVITIQWQGKKQKVYLQKDNIYTLSFYAISTDASNTIGFYTNEFVKTIVPTTSWTRYSVTFKYKGETGGEYIILQANKAVTGDIKICGIQLEDGLIMSEYKESKEDFKV